MGDNLISNQQSQYRPSVYVPQHKLEAQASQKTPESSVKYLEPIIKEKRLWNMNYVLTAFILGFVVVTIQAVAMNLFTLDPVGAWVLAFVLLLIYAISLYFLLEPKLLKEVTQPVVKTEKFVERVDRPVEIVKTIDRPVIERVEVEKPVYLEKKVYIERKRKKLNIPKYKYVGSNLTKVYHLKTCRLAKSIKNKYKVHNNSPRFFKSRKYRPCAVCVLRIKKV